MGFDFTNPQYYLWFLPVTLILVFAVSKRKRSRQIGILCAMSYTFFILASGWHVLLLLTSTLVDWSAGNRIHRIGEQRLKKRWLKLSLVTNLTLLGVFKYLDLMIETLGWWSLQMGGSLPFNPPGLLLPVGISFYTFQTMSYTIDIYRGENTPADTFIDFACYAAFFPQLVAGPIVRFDYFRKQIDAPLEQSVGRFRLGLSLIVYGLVKKLVFADNFALHVNSIFVDGAPLDNLILVYWGAFLFGLQIYCDFSAYTDIAIGSGHLFGIRLPENFKGPYGAASPSEFWRRWHVSLSTWLRDYLYISLGGNRHGVRRMYFALMTTMILGGLWHGASWNFVLWGLLHGLLLIAHRNISGKKWNIRFAETRPRLHHLSALMVTQWFIFLTWLVFRVEETAMMLRSLKTFIFIDVRLDPIEAFDSLPGLQWLMIILALGFCIVHCASTINGGRLKYAVARLPNIRWGLVMGLGIASIWLLRPQEAVEFIYFRF